MLATILNSAVELFNIEILDDDNFAELLMRFAFNFGIIWFLIRQVYYKKTRRRDYLFTFLLIGIVVFLMCFLLENVKLELGFALGLFAVFGIIRYRTMAIPIKEMTYLFIVIGLSVINALANKKVSYVELLFTNVAILTITWYIERLKSFEGESYAQVLYEKIDLIVPERREELLADLSDRLGVTISRIEIGTVDFQRDVVKIRVYFMKSQQTWSDSDDVEFRTISNEA